MSDKENVNDVSFDDAIPFEGSATDFLKGDFLKPIELLGQGTVNTTITDTKRIDNWKWQDGRTSNLGLLYLEGFSKPLQLNNSQIITLAELAESIRMKDWHGMEIGMRTVDVMIGGETKKTIRITEPKKQRGKAA